MNYQATEPIDEIHAASMQATRELRTQFGKTWRYIQKWELSECPPRPFRPAKPLSVWLDGEAADVPVPVSWDAAKVWDADDPLLKPRPWLR